jgi:hypothetical protein
MSLIILGVTCCLLVLWVLGFLGSRFRFSLHIPVCWHRSDSRMGGLLVVMAVVLLSYIAATCFDSTIVYPASTNLGALTNAECKPDTMFISHAVMFRLCLRSIFLVAFPVHPSGNMNIFLDILPVSSRSGSSSSRATPDVAPKSRKAYHHAFLFANLRTQCAATRGGTDKIIKNNLLNLLFFQ